MGLLWAQRRLPLPHCVQSDLGRNHRSVIRQEIKRIPTEQPQGEGEKEKCDRGGRRKQRGKLSQYKTQKGGEYKSVLLLVMGTKVFPCAKFCVTRPDSKSQSDLQEIRKDPNRPQTVEGEKEKVRPGGRHKQRGKLSHYKTKKGGEHKICTTQIE